MDATRRNFFRGSAKAVLAGSAMAATALVAHAAPEPKRRLLHLEVGDENWQPTPEEMQELVQHFQIAEQDPLGAIIATRKGVRATLL